MSTRRAALPARRALADVLLDLAREGRTVACHGSDRPISEDPDDREYTSLRWCPSCPALDACREAGRYERHGVWGAVDRTPTSPSQSRQEPS